MKIKTVLLSLLVVCVLQPAIAKDDGIENLRQTGKAFASVARAVSPSVVYIQVEVKASASGESQFSIPFGDDFFRRFFGDQFPNEPEHSTPRNEQLITGQGSGFVFAEDDGLLTDTTYILTNSHVVANAEKIRVRLQDGREFDASVKGSDPKTDVAVIEIKQGGLQKLALADSSKLEVGEWVVALGNPFGLSHSLTVGVVSAKGRTSLGLNDYEDFIQTDAAINPGNSGGPLVNLDGEVVGINTAIFSRSGGYMGVGFAIPINLARAIAKQLIEKGEVTRGYLGVIIQALTPELAESFGIDQTQGILIAQVSDDSPADKAGLKQGDIIVAYNGKPVTDVGGFRNRIALTSPGTREQITIIRGSKRKNVNVTIGKLTDDKLLASDSSHSSDEIGLSVQTITPELAQQFGVEAGEGVVVTAVTPGSIAAQGGIRPGTVIMQVNQQPVKNAVQFKRIVGEALDDKRLLLLVKRDGVQQFIVLSW